MECEKCKQTADLDKDLLKKVASETRALMFQIQKRPSVHKIHPEGQWIDPVDSVIIDIKLLRLANNIWNQETTTNDQEKYEFEHTVMENKTILMVQKFYAFTQNRFDLFPIQIIVPLALSLTLMLLGEECPRLCESLRYRHISNLVIKEMKANSSQFSPEEGIDMFRICKGFLFNLLLPNEDEPTMLIQQKFEPDQGQKQKVITYINDQLDDGNGNCCLNFNAEDDEATTLAFMTDISPKRTLPSSSIRRLQEDLYLTASEDESNQMEVIQTSQVEKASAKLESKESQNKILLDESIVLDTEKKAYRCPNCQEHYQKDKWKLRRHLESCQRRLESQKFKCQWCNVRFTRRFSLKKHLELRCKKKP